VSLGAKRASIDLVGVSKARLGPDTHYELHVERLTIMEGESVAIVGPSGSGKTTLLDLLSFLFRPDRAERFLLGCAREGTSDIAALWNRGRLNEMTRLRRQHFGYVLQSGGLLPFLSVFENIALPQRLNGCFDAGRIRALAERLQIADQLPKMPGQLSHGQRQRAAIARAVSHSPSIILADEPTASVNPALADEIFSMLLSEAKARGATLIVASHDHERVGRWGLEVIACAIQRQANSVRGVFSRAASASSGPNPASAAAQ
jgi:ABC-type lipoprotein export system ATPase subunit